MPPEPPISERCAIVGLAHTEADEEPALVVVHTPFLGLGAGHARQVGLPADVIDQYRAAPAGLLLVACAHHGRALAGMVQEHDRAPGIGGDGLHATDDLGHGAAGFFFLDVEPAQRVQHHQAAALGGALIPFVRLVKKLQRSQLKERATRDYQAKKIKTLEANVRILKSQLKSNNRKLKVLEYLAEKHGISVNEIDEETKKQRNEKGG